MLVRRRLWMATFAVAALLLVPRVGVIAGQETACQGLKTWTTAEDHGNMLAQLGIKALRTGPSGNEKDPNHANFDEALANPFPDLPAVLVLRNGRKVSTAAEWAERRQEIVEEFERAVVGRIPARVPAVKWSVVERANGAIGGMPVAGRQLVGRVDNSGCPGIGVEIQFTLVTPAGTKGPVPVMIMFRGGGLGQALGTAPPPAARPGFTPPPGALGTDPPATEQLIADGWGFAFLNPASLQADNGAGLTRGIIGLVNEGQPRKPDDWGSLRAWSWGAARALDYLETDPAVDAKRVGIEGVSRYGKAALVTMAFEPRFAVVLVGSSGEGGAKLHRRNFGEAVENLTGEGEYHWMAGNFLKYGASEATFGSKNAGDLPVDAHELIALCAPRPTFISYGIPERGDAKWLDQQGSFMATVAAGPVFRLLGAKDLGTSDDYKTEKMPAVNVGLLDGHLAWRQHDGGHTDGPNWKHFIPWADRLLGHKKPQRVVPADQPAARYDANSLVAHAQLLDKAKAGGIDVYFVGDSITRRWGATDYPELLANWTKNFFGWNAGNFGWGADGTENILWRLEHGELDGVNPGVIVVLAGTNNVGATPGDDTKVAEITRGVRAILDACRRKAPGATIVLTAIFPRNDNVAVMPEITRINENIALFADGKLVRYLDVSGKLADKEGRLFPGMMHDKLHPTVQGYQVWADGLKPILREVLGPPAATDHAPPPTGDVAASALLAAVRPVGHQEAMFSEGDAYERFMGRWSRDLAHLLVRFSGVRDGDAVLDIGSGTGALTAAIAKAAPSSTVLGIEPAAPYVAFAQARHGGDRVRFEVGDAQRLQLKEGTFDRTLSLLVLNFIPDPGKAINEMIRVTRRGGTIAAAVWDYGQGMEMLRVFWDEAVALNPGKDARDERHMPLCRRGELAALWRGHGLIDVSEEELTIPTRFSSFDDYWSPFLDKQGPAGAYVAALSPSDREQLRLRLRRRLLGEGPDHPIALHARAWAVRGTVPPKRGSTE